MNRQRNNLAAIAWAGCLLIRKAGWPLSGAVFYAGTFAFIAFLSVQLIRSCTNQRTHSSRLEAWSNGLALLGLLLILPKQFSSIDGTALSRLGLLASLASIIIILVAYRTFRRQAAGIYIIFVAALLTAILQPRQFHRLFRSSTFESYVTNKFMEGSGEAEKILRAYAPTDQASKQLAKTLGLDALKADSARNLKESMKYFDESIDLNPFDAYMLYCRGRTKLIRLELDEEVALSAVKDLSRSIRLDPANADAYYYRANAYSYLGKKLNVCPDVMRCVELDTSYARLTEDLKNVFCKSSGSDFPAE